MHNLSNQVWSKAVYDGYPKGDAETSDGTFGTAIDIDYTCPRVLFLIHGVNPGATDSTVVNASTAVVAWELLGQSTYAKASDADFTDYAAIEGATHGDVSFADSTVTMGPFMLDVNAVKALGGSGSLLMHFWTDNSDTVVDVHCVALGYGGLHNKQPASDVISV